MPTMTLPQLALRTLRTTHGIFLASVVFYGFVGERMKTHVPYSGSSAMVLVVALLALAVAGTALMVRGRMVNPAAALLHRRAEDRVALKNWQIGTLVSLALAESVGLCGVWLRASGVPLAQVLPFYALAIVMIALWRPRLDLPSPDA